MAVNTWCKLFESSASREQYISKETELVLITAGNPVGKEAACKQSSCQLLTILEHLNCDCVSIVRFSDVFRYF